MTAENCQMLCADSRRFNHIITEILRYTKADPPHFTKTGGANAIFAVLGLNIIN